MTKLKTIYFGNRREIFKYKTMKDLQDEGRKHGITIGKYLSIPNGVVIGRGATIGNYVSIWKGAVIGRGATIGNYVSIWNSVVIGRGATIGNYVEITFNSRIGSHSILGEYSKIEHCSVIGKNSTIGDNVYIGEYVTIGNDVGIGCCSTVGKSAVIGNGIEILRTAKIRVGWIIEDIVHIRNAFEYRTLAYRRDCKIAIYTYHVSGYRIDGKIVIQIDRYTRTLREWEDDFWIDYKELRRGTPAGEGMLKAFNKIKAIMKGQKG